MPPLNPFDRSNNPLKQQMDQLEAPVPEKKISLPTPHETEDMNKVEMQKLGRGNFGFIMKSYPRLPAAAVLESVVPDVESLDCPNHVGSRNSASILSPPSSLLGGA